MVQQEPSMLGEIYNVLQQMKLESDRLVDSTRTHASGLPDVSHDYHRNQDHRSDRSSVQSWRPMIPTSRYDNQSLSHHTHKIDIVVTANVNQPSIIVVDVVRLLPSDAVTIMIGIILQQMNLMNTRRQR